MARPMSGATERDGGLVSVGEEQDGVAFGSCNVCRTDVGRPRNTYPLSFPGMVVRLCEEHLRLTGEVITMAQEGR